MQYSIRHTKSHKLFGLKPIHIEGWETEPFIEYADAVIEDGTHDEINRVAGFPGKALDMIKSGEWDAKKIHPLHAIHFYDKLGNKHLMYGWECPEAEIDKKFTVLEIPETSWVVVTAALDGECSAIKKSYEDLYVNWFPTSEYNQAKNIPIVEKYNENTCELWMPLERKAI